MKKTTALTIGVTGIVLQARTFHQEIGTYQEHYINENYNFTVKLSNGEMDMALEIAMDYEARPSSVTSDRIDIVAGTFRKT